MVSDLVEIAGHARLAQEPEEFGKGFVVFRGGRPVGLAWSDVLAKETLADIGAHSLPSRRLDQSGVLAFAQSKRDAWRSTSVLNLPIKAS
jgi:hypothetical protein